MRRRYVLSTLASTGMTALAGCGALEDWFSPADEERQQPPASEDAGTEFEVEPRPLAELGNPGDICESEPIDDPGIYAIDDPVASGDWTAIDPPSRYGDDGRLTDDRVVVGLERDGQARAYPLSILWYHEIVNDDVGGPVLVTYCPLCLSAMVAERRVEGEATRFVVSGQLWIPPELQTRASEAENRTFGVDREDAEQVAVRNQGNLVLVDDATGSYWSQLVAKAICGPQTGERLSMVPTTVATWGEWRADQPGTDVLLPPPYSGTVA